MTMKQLVVTIPRDEKLQRRLRKAAKVRGQSLRAFVEGAAEQWARHVLLDWAVDRYIEGERSFGELAEETGLSVEEIMTAMERIGDRDRAAALAALWDRTHEEASAMFLTSAASISRFAHDPTFLRRVERVAADAPVVEQQADADGQ